MRATQSELGGDRTQSAAEFSEVQFAMRRHADMEKVLRILEWEKDTENDIRNALADRMVQNQKLATSEERHADGFSIIYGDLNKSDYRLIKLREAAAALKAIL